MSGGGPTIEWQVPPAPGSEDFASTVGDFAEEVFDSAVESVSRLFDPATCEAINPDGSTSEIGLGNRITQSFNITESDQLANFSAIGEPFENIGFTNPNTLEGTPDIIVERESVCLPTGPLPGWMPGSAGELIPQSYKIMDKTHTVEVSEQGGSLQAFQWANGEREPLNLSDTRNLEQVSAGEFPGWQRLNPQPEELSNDTPDMSIVQYDTIAYKEVQTGFWPFNGTESNKYRQPRMMVRIIGEDPVTTLSFRPETTDAGNQGIRAHIDNGLYFEPASIRSLYGK